MHAHVEHRPDGSLVLRSTEALKGYPRTLTERLARWALECPDRVLVAKRDEGGIWQRLRYGEMLQRVRSIAQALLERHLSIERPIAILSGNDLEHLQLALGAMWAGIPICPVSPGYSLLSTDFARLGHVMRTLTPGLVFAAHAQGYAAAIQSVVPRNVEIVLTRGSIDGHRVTSFETLRAMGIGAEADLAHAAVTPDTIAKFLFTSGSATQPKAVITTQRMLCANQQMLSQCLRFLDEEPPVLVDWLPWNHTFGGSHNLGLVLYHGGTLYIDEGRPTASHFGQTVRNLREIAPTVYFNVPKGWEDLVAALETDAVLRETFFSRVKLLFYAGAGLSQAVWDRLDRVAASTVGERIRMVTGLGMTETSPSSLFALGPEVQAGYVGLPAPGCATKLVPIGSQFEARFHGPHVMPGYWRDAAQTRKVFDEERFYCTGDAVRVIDPARPELGLKFEGRMTEDFKLSSGSFVSVSRLIRRVVQDGAPYVMDAVVTGENRVEIGLLIFPRLEACRDLAQALPESGASAILNAPSVREFFQGLLNDLACTATGSSNRVARAHVLREPPSFDLGEITDKGSINQRAVLSARAALIEALYQASGIDVIFPTVHPSSSSQKRNPLTLDAYSSEDPGSPPSLFPGYRSTALRSPLQALLPIEQTLTEVTGPSDCWAQLMGTAVADLTSQHTGAPLGQRIIVQGRVLDEYRRPVPRTIMEIWQANAAGRYVHHRDTGDAPLDPNFTGAGRVVTDTEGRYRYVTVRPGAYPWGNHYNAWRPAHIHLSLLGPAFATRLVTQMYFPDDPLIDIDPIANSVPMPYRQRLVARFDIALCESGRALGYTFDLVLKGAKATPFEDS